MNAQAMFRKGKEKVKDEKEGRENGHEEVNKTEKIYKRLSEGKRKKKKKKLTGEN